MTAPRPTAARRIVALAACLTLVTSACMFNDDDDSQKVSSGGLGFDPVESGLPDDAEPKRGGQIVYGLEAETGASDKDGEVGTGWCMPEAQIAISGMQVARALYDPLVVPDANGDYVPYLAKSLSHNDDFTEWTIGLRDDVMFHDESILTAEVLKNNLDAYRGQYEGRSSLLFRFVFANVESVTATNELTVTVKMKEPWVAFDAALYSSGRIMIIAQAQLDMPKEWCANSPIGTGPFKFEDWKPNVALKANRWPNYWQIAPDGEPYPYVESIEFRPMPNSDARVNALLQGDINMMHTSTVADIAVNLAQLRDAGEINMLVSEERTETSYLMFNLNTPGLEDLAVRKAIAQSIDHEDLNKTSNAGAGTLANGPLAPEVLGYLEDPGATPFDLDAAKEQVAALKKANQPTTFELLSSSNAASIRNTGVIKQQLEAAGFTINIDITAESELINRAIGGDYEIVSFRNQPGDDPDSNYNWWHSGGETNNLLNFGRFKDPIIDENLEIGRRAEDREVRREAYENVSRQLVSQVYNYYLYFTTWAVAEASNIHGILGPNLPHEDGEPSTRLVTGHPLLGVWIDEG